VADVANYVDTAFNMLSDAAGGYAFEPNEPAGIESCAPHWIAADVSPYGIAAGAHNRIARRRNGESAQ
jgi:hypothetical protein